MFLSKVLIWNLILSVFLTSTGLRAQEFGSKREKFLKAAEYTYKRYEKENLIPIRLLGAVKNPGLYQLPVSTDIVTAITLAGGYTEKAILDKVTVTSYQDNKILTKKLDVNKMLQGGASPGTSLHANDVVLIPEVKPVVSQNTLTLITIASSLIAVIVSGLVVSKSL